MPFDVAIYTDVLAGEAIDGIDGFNFQAVSSGLTALDQQRIREGLMHRVLPSWSIGHDELNHPPTCAYSVHDGRSYLARGRSTGVTNSGRPGNQLTQVIATSEGDDFVPYRPAQLYGALDWSLAKARGSRLDPWLTPLEIRPEFEAESLREMVRGDTWATAALPHLLTMLDESLSDEPRKLVLLHHDLDVVMRWIALGTLFVDIDTAKAVQFRALVDDPWRTHAQIVGVSPEFGRTEFAGANVLDLEGRSRPVGTPSEAARTWAGWFMSLGTDEALAAIEVARRWQPALGPALATRAARIVGFADGAGRGRDAWDTATTVVERLAAAGLREDLELYTEELAGAISSYGPATAPDFHQAGRATAGAHRAGAAELAAAVALPTLEALAAFPAAAGGWAAELAALETPMGWPSADDLRAAGGFLGEVLAHAPGRTLPDLFAAARAVAVPVPEAKLRLATVHLADLWLREPGIGMDRTGRWLAADSVVSALTGELLARLGAGDQDRTADLMRGDWDFLGSLIGDAALAGWLKAGRIGRASREERVQLISEPGWIPPAAWRIALADTALPGDAGLWAAWVDRHGLAEDLAAAIYASAEVVLNTAPEAAAELGTGDWAALLGAIPPESEPRLARLAVECTSAITVLAAARNNLREQSDARLPGGVPGASGWAPFVLGDLGWLLVHAMDPGDVRELLEASGPWGPVAIQRELRRLIRSKNWVRAIEHALRNVNDEPGTARAVFEDALAELFRAQPGLAERARLRRGLRGGVEEFLRRRPGPQGARRGLGALFERGRRTDRG